MKENNILRLVLNSHKCLANNYLMVKREYIVMWRNGQRRTLISSRLWVRIPPSLPVTIIFMLEKKYGVSDNTIRKWVKYYEKLN